MGTALPDTPESAPVSGISGYVRNFKAASLRHAKAVDSKWWPETGLNRHLIDIQRLFPSPELKYSDQNPADN
jgi:hypothetical protein